MRQIGMVKIGCYSLLRVYVNLKIKNAMADMKDERVATKWIITVVCITCALATLTVLRSHIGLTSRPSARSRSPCLKNSSITRDAHSR